MDKPLVVMSIDETVAAAGLAKMLDGCTMDLSGWHVIAIKPHHAIQCSNLAWIVEARYKDTEQSMWTHLTGSEIFAWRLRKAKERKLAQERASLDKEKEAANSRIL